MENLNKLANAQINCIIDTYKGETRDWWNHVDEDAIYEAIRVCTPLRDGRHTL